MGRQSRLDIFNSCEILDSVSGFDDVRKELAAHIRSTSGVCGRGMRSVFVAATAVLALALCALLLLVTLPHPSEVQWIREYTSAGESRKVVLPDSSIIWLNSHSEVFYPSSFLGRERKVFLSGEAYADVTKDSRHPFVIDAEGVRILVHGTRFNVKAFRQSDLREVFLEEGSVTMSVGSGRNSITLAPNDLVRYSVSQDMLEKYSVMPETYCDWRVSKDLVFFNMKLSDILSDLEHHFNVRFIVSHDVPLDTRYYASFINGESVIQVLNALNTDGRLGIRHYDDCIMISNNSIDK